MNREKLCDRQVVFLQLLIFDIFYFFFFRLPKKFVILQHVLLTVCIVCSIVLVKFVLSNLVTFKIF